LHKHIYKFHSIDLKSKRENQIYEVNLQSLDK
jgi:hypothetical protein